MVWIAYCDVCGIQLSKGPESHTITVNVEEMVYYDGQLCKTHWTELMEILDKFFPSSRDKET